MTDDYFDRAPRSRLALIALACGILALLLALAAPLGYRVGWWDYPVALKQVTPLAGLLALLATVLGCVGLGRSWPGSGRRGVFAAALGVLLGLALLLPLGRGLTQATRLPQIHDVTTDLADPPAFRAAAELRARDQLNPTDYAGEELALQQRAAYPDLAPLVTERDPVEMHGLALSLARDYGWEILASEPPVSADGEQLTTGRIEASVRGGWYNFTDDVVVRVRPRDGGSVIDLRSSSRVGISDLGANAARIRAFLADLATAAK